MDISLAVVLMITLYPVMGSRGIALAIVIATWCQVIYYLWQSKSVLKVSIAQLVPVKKLVVKFLLLLTIYLLLSLLLRNLPMATSLSVAAVATAVAVAAGTWSYLKSFFKK